MRKVLHEHASNRVPLPLNTWPEPSVEAWPSPRGTWLMKHQLTCPIMTDWLQSKLYLVTFSPLHLFSYTFVYLTCFLTSLLLHSFCHCPWGFSFTLHMPRQLHSLPLHVQVYGHTLDEQQSQKNLADCRNFMLLSTEKNFLKNVSHWINKNC